MRIVEITEQEKMQLSELGHEAVEAMHGFLECLDKVSDGQISAEMESRYGQRRGVSGTGHYGRRENEHYGERQYGRRSHYPEHEIYDARRGYEERDGQYGNRYDY